MSRGRPPATNHGLPPRTHHRTQPEGRAGHRPRSCRRCRRCRIRRGGSEESCPPPHRKPPPTAGRPRPPAPAMLVPRRPPRPAFPRSARKKADEGRGFRAEASAQAVPATPRQDALSPRGPRGRANGQRRTRRLHRGGAPAKCHDGPSLPKGFPNQQLGRERISRLYGHRCIRFSPFFTHLGLDRKPTRECVQRCPQCRSGATIFLGNRAVWRGVASGPPIPPRRATTVQQPASHRALSHQICQAP